MGKVWVLDTETKGTGAQMVPLEKTLKQPAAEPVRRRARPVPKRRPRTREAEPAPPRRFRVIDALSREIVAEDAGLAETVELLGDVGQPVEVSELRLGAEGERLAPSDEARAVAPLGPQARGLGEHHDGLRCRRRL